MSDNAPPGQTRDLVRQLLSLRRANALAWSAGFGWLLLGAGLFLYDAPIWIMAPVLIAHFVFAAAMGERCRRMPCPRCGELFFSPLRTPFQSQCENCKQSIWPDSPDSQAPPGT